MELKKILLVILKLVISFFGSFFLLYLILGFKSLQGYSFLVLKEYGLSFFQIPAIARVHWIYLIVLFIIIYIILHIIFKRMNKK